MRRESKTPMTLRTGQGLQTSVERSIRQMRVNPIRRYFLQSESESESELLYKSDLSPIRFFLLNPNPNPSPKYAVKSDPKSENPNPK